MQSAFNTKKPSAVSSNSALDETYNLRGLNLTDPDDIMPQGQSPWTINSRMYARNDGESRVANRTRMGASHLSEPVGAAANVSNVGASTGDLSFSTVRVIAQPFIPSSTGAITKVQPQIKKAAGATGHIIVEIWTNKAGVPGDMIAQGSILASMVTTSYQYLNAYFIDAPTLTNGTQYWLVVYVQDNGSGTYYLNQTATVGALDLTSSDNFVSWSSINCSVRYKTFLSTAGGVKGWHLRYPSDGTNRILIAHGTTVQSIVKATGVVTAIDTGLNASAARYRFAQWDDQSMYCNGFDPLRWWNGTDAPTNVNNVPSINPFNVIIWQNRVFVMRDKTRVDFSELSDPETWPSVNFFYVPSPKSPDHMTGWLVFQDNLTIFTHETKHVIIGSDISNFTRKEAVGTKGAVSQEAIARDRNYIYFMADDKQIYRWNGVSDQLMSKNVEPELHQIPDVSQVRLEMHRNQLRVYYPKSPSGFNNQMLLLDLEENEWFMDTGHPVAGAAQLYLDDNELVEFSSVVGRVYFGETQFSDLGKMIDWQYRTNYKSYGYRRRTGQSFGGGSTKKRIKRFRPVIRTADADYTMLVGKDMDFAENPDMREYIVSGGGAKWGGFKWGDGTKWGKTKQVQNLSGMSGRGNYIQYRFERKGVETPVELYGYIAQYKTGRPK